MVRGTDLGPQANHTPARVQRSKRFLANVPGAPDEAGSVSPGVAILVELDEVTGRDGGGPMAMTREE